VRTSAGGASRWLSAVADHCRVVVFLPRAEGFQGDAAKSCFGANKANPPSFETPGERRLFVFGPGSLAAVWEIV
jgi:hypothetical protein